LPEIPAGVGEGRIAIIPGVVVDELRAALGAAEARKDADSG